MSPQYISIRLSVFTLLFLALSASAMPMLSLHASVEASHSSSVSSSIPSFFSGREDAERLLSRISATQELAVNSSFGPLSINPTSVLAQGGPDEEHDSANWRRQTLSPEALKAVMQESLESAAKANELRANLQAIHDQLRTRKIAELQKRIDALQSDEASVVQEKERLTDQKQRIDAIFLAFDRATLDVEAKRNSDPRLYKRVLDREQELHLFDAMLDTGTRTSDDGLHEVPLSDEERLHTIEKQAFLREQLALMKNGVPDDIAQVYLEKKRAADDARIEDQSVATLLERKESTLIEIRAGLSTLQDQLEKAKQKQFALPTSDTFVWPVSGPITAGFFDQDYEHVFGVPHRAIDIATRQSSPVHAISDGVVYAVHDGGLTGYSYVLLGHADGYSSLYGHVSQFLVHTGETVSAGQVIALSGGAPGTHGAGHMTTGSHLHLEVMKNGVHIDPRGVLPVGK